MRQGDKSVLVLGGYGAAGTATATFLGQRIDGNIVLAGRSLEKGRKRAEQLDREAGVTGRFNARSIDVADAAQARQCSHEQDVVIVACDLSVSALENLVHGCIANRADYIDITPNPRKLEVFQGMRTLIETSDSRFVLDVGADPGLPGWLARWLCQASPGTVKDIQMYGRYRSTDIGWGGVADILSAADRQGWKYNGGWTQSRFWDVRYRRFEGGLGSSICVPVFLDELHGLPQELSLECFSFYHAGLNPVTDVLMTFERTGMLGCFSFKSRQRAFYSALKRFTNKPFGLELTAESRGDRASRRVSIGHHDLYRATAIPAAIHCESLLEGSGDESGVRWESLSCSQRDVRKRLLIFKFNSVSKDIIEGFNFILLKIKEKIFQCNNFATDTKHHLLSI
jgi:NAD(P)-dependent dehydrogenase (short-subunit alcohol dehydrogenase family)